MESDVVTTGKLNEYIKVKQRCPAARYWGAWEKSDKQ
jgi:hypothetical protein